MPTLCKYPLAVSAVLLVSVLTFQPAAILAQTSSGTSNNPMIYPPDAKPYGKSYSEWTTEWWKWFVSIPNDDNPINDQTGQNCAVGQNGPVWFLVGSGGGEAERSCEVPAGKAILIPAIIVECSYAEDDSLKTEADLRTCAKSDQDQVTDVSATIDGTELSDQQVYRVDSPLFDVTFPNNNVFSAAEGPTQAVSDGFWVFIKPLPPGKHDIHVKGLMVDYTVTAPINFVEDSAYHLTVSAPPSYSEHEQAITITGKSIPLLLASSSNISNVEFDEDAKQLSFIVTPSSEQSEHVTTVPISRVLGGPYTVMLDGEPISDYGVYEDKTTAETIMTIPHSQESHNVVITGTNVVPELSYAIATLIATLGVIVIFGRAKLVGRLS